MANDRSRANSPTGYDANSASLSNVFEMHDVACELLSNHCDAQDICRLASVATCFRQPCLDEAVWLRQHEARWKTPARRLDMAAAPPAGWRNEYKRRHKKDQQASECVLKMSQGGERNSNSAWEQLLRLGEEVICRVALLCTEPGGLDTAGRDVAQTCLVGLNQQAAMNEWVDLMGRDGHAAGERAGGEGVGGEGGRDGGRAAQPPLAVEEGALLLVRLYQNAEQLIAQYLHDELSSVDRVRAELDALASRLRARLLAKQKGDLGTAVDGSSPSSSPNEDEDADAGEAVRELKALLFVEEGLRGADSADYYNFENSLLDCVLSARRGIPISLSCIFAAVCHRVGVSLDMIGLPGHFLLATRPHDARSRRPQPEQRGAGGAGPPAGGGTAGATAGPAERIFVDAFHGGELLRLRQCEAIVRSYGYAWSEEMAMPVQPIEVCTRMLRNLLNAHKQSGDARAARVIDCVLASSSRSSAPLLPNPLRTRRAEAATAEAEAFGRQFLNMDPSAMSSQQQQQLLQMLMQQMHLQQAAAAAAAEAEL